MTETSVILLDAGAPGRLIWARNAGRRVVWGAVEPGDKAPAAVRQGVAVAPGEDVTAHRLVLPKGSERQARAAAPFAIEDEVGVDLDDVLVALAPRRAGETERCAYVVSHQRMEAWRQMLDAAGVTPSAIAPDYALIGAEAPTQGSTRAQSQDAGAVLLDLGERLIFADGDAGAALERDLALRVLPALLAGVERLRVCANDAAALAPATGWPEPTTLQPGLDESGYLRLLLTGASAQTGVDLRQGAYADHQIDLTALAPWRGAALAAGLALTAWIGAGLAETRALRLESAKAREATAAVYARAFPGEAVPRDPAARLAERTRSLNTGGLLDAAARVFDAVGAVDGVRLESLTYDAARDGMAVTVTYAAYEELEALRLAVEARGGRLEEGGSRRRGDQVIGDLVVRAQ